MLICIEGIDGSGKATQSQLLVNALRDRYGDERVLTMSFPRYGQSFFAREVGAYLNGERGTLAQVHPRFSAILFAGDRFQAKPELEQALAGGKIVVCDRYVASNTAHQGARLPAAEREAFYHWNDELEHQVFGLPRPHVNFFIDVPPHVAWELVAKKKARDYTDKQRDIQEAEAGYLQEVYRVYQDLAASQRWTVLPCLQAGELKTPQQIFSELWEALLATGQLPS
ncbi:MAG: dTMP kinase [Xanthomonadales bacterium]|nr:dTMP kinase [Xanthomonadales bacterium]